MAQYCKAGDTARVTFLDGSIQEYSDTPITIECQDGNLTCAQQDSRRFTVNFGWSYRRVSDDVVVSASFVRTNVSLPIGNTFIAPFGSIPLALYIQVPVNNADRQACRFSDASVSAPSPEKVVLWHGITSITLTSDPEVILPRKTLTVTGASGTQLFSGNFDDCGYSVECLEGCPPNTLDCGDCCLNCQPIFNQLSALRAQLARLN